MIPARWRAALSAELLEFPLARLRHAPGATGRALRGAYWRRRLRGLGTGVVIGENVRIVGPEWLTIGDGCWIDDNVTLIAGPLRIGGRRVSRVGDTVLPDGELRIGARVHVSNGALVQAHGGVAIGDDLTLGAGCRVYSVSHHYRNPDDPDDTTRYLFGSCSPPERQCVLVGNVLIEGETAVGANAIVLPGTVLRSGSWLGAGSVLSGETPANAILRGNPAVVVRERMVDRSITDAAR